MTTHRLTVAQALLRFLANQHTERDGQRQRLIAGCWGIFGHGNVAGVGQALLESGEQMPYLQGRHGQAMVHAAVGFARQRNRMSTYACTTSIGPGATNLVTGAALATINHLPVLLLPGDVFATRPADPVLQQLEVPHAKDVSVKYPELHMIHELVDQVNAVLDAEIVAFDEDGKNSFEALQQRMNLSNEREIKRISTKIPVALVAFDLLWLDGHDLTGLPLEERRELLETVVEQDHRLQVVTHVDGEGKAFV